MDNWLTPQSIAGLEMAVLAGPWASKNRGQGFGEPVITGTARTGAEPGKTALKWESGMLSSVQYGGMGCDDDDSDGAGAVLGSREAARDG
ncbi:hypothetical protein SCAR479_11949 [Seiridium cardinale]|uniref:Uncharacterized protein n=1 Tax=Seiridium cardinale TaxID=138064 RepID=A0ABR2XC33_9PEZI